MVVAQLGVSTDDAMALLRTHAFAHGATLAQIADHVVAKRLDYSGTDAEVDRDDTEKESQSS